jgi:type I restriction enzyme S subunit
LYKKFEIKSGAVGAIFKNLTTDQIKAIEFPKLDLIEQQQIAQQLKQADVARQKRKAANALTDQFLQSTFLSMFGDPIENPKDWNKEKVRKIVSSFISGKSVQSEQRRKLNGEYGVLKVSAVTYGYFKAEEHKAITNGYIPDELIKPKKGDILFSRANTKELVAATCIVDRDYNDLFLPDKLWKIMLNKKKVNSVFFKYVLSHQSFRNKLSEQATGTSGSMFNISKEKLYEFDFPIPPFALQQKFASIVADTEKLRQKQKQTEIELENLFQALLQKYFG